MPKLRYAIAALFFAASVGCLALWWRSFLFSEIMISPSRPGGYEFVYGSSRGTIYLSIDETMQPATTWAFHSARRGEYANTETASKMFGAVEVGIYFPHWYPALVFALASVAVLRFRRRFSIRSAMVGLAVVAALLGMVVAL